MKRNISLLLTCALIWYFFIYDPSETLGPGILAIENPEQIIIKNPQNLDFNDYTLTPLAKFRIKAKVLSKKNYYLGRETDLSPMDFALGWGPMSDEATLATIEITQSNRWANWKVEAFPIPRREIEIHMANMHLIPSNDYVKSMLKKVKKGQIIEMTGNLVKVKGSDGWVWSSSLTRSDTGSHACEIIWVENVAVQ